ncbi:MAG: hypothetical protein K6G55_03550 [Selenomonadaceae bacterium]|nr:hypothetical protein [Selenomonadaceae bacterium]
MFWIVLIFIFAIALLVAFIHMLITNGTNIFDNYDGDGEDNDDDDNDSDGGGDGGD